MVFPFFPDGKKHHFPMDFRFQGADLGDSCYEAAGRDHLPKLLYLYRHTFVYLLMSCFIFNLD